MSAGPTTYTPNPVHRNRTPGKSQWTISLTDEHKCFGASVVNAWLVGDVGWGIHYASDPQTLDYLGVARDHSTLVFIAKFVGNAGCWHGFPADHQQSRLDIPDQPILQSWLSDRILTPAKIRKILKGQSCLL